MSLRKIYYAPDARQDLREIHTYVSADDPIAADRLIARIMETTDLLAGMPSLGRARPEVGANLRSINVGTYRIYYQIEDTWIDIVHVLHQSRNEAEALRKRFRRDR